MIILIAILQFGTLTIIVPDRGQAEIQSKRKIYKSKLSDNSLGKLTNPHEDFHLKGTSLCKLSLESSGQKKSQMRTTRICV